MVGNVFTLHSSVLENINSSGLLPGSDSPISAARELRFYFPALKLAQPSSFDSAEAAGEAAKTYLSEATAGAEQTFLQVLQKG